MGYHRHSLDLTGLDTLAEVTARLQASEPVGPEEWIFGWGLDPNIFNGPLSGRSFKDSLQNRPMEGSREILEAIEQTTELESLTVAGLVAVGSGIAGDTECRLFGKKPWEP